MAGYDPNLWNGFTDFSLYELAGQVIAVIEAKRTARNPREGEEQLSQYVTEIAKDLPFIPGTLGFSTMIMGSSLSHPQPAASGSTPEVAVVLRG